MIKSELAKIILSHFLFKILWIKEISFTTTLHFALEYWHYEGPNILRVGNGSLKGYISFWYIYVAEANLVGENNNTKKEKNIFGC